MGGQVHRLSWVQCQGPRKGWTDGWEGCEQRMYKAKGKECLPRNNTHRPEQTQAAKQAVLRLSRMSSVPPDPKPANKIR